MALLKKWRDMAYSETANKGDLQRLWAEYFQKEKDIYAELLKNPEEVVSGTVKELAEKYSVDIMTMTGFLDGINDSLKEVNPIEEMEEDTSVSMAFCKFGSETKFVSESFCDMSVRPSQRQTADPQNKVRR